MLKQKYSDYINMILMDLSVDWGLAPMQLTDEKECFLQYKNDFQVCIKVNDTIKTVTLYAYLFDLKDFESDHFYKTLMSWNYEGFGKSGFYLSYCERNHALTSVAVYNNPSPEKIDISCVLDNFIEENLKIYNKVINTFSQVQHPKDTDIPTDYSLRC